MRIQSKRLVALKLDCRTLVDSCLGSGAVLLRNSRKTDSLPAAKSTEFLFRLVPPEAAFALLVPSWALTVNGAWPSNGPFQFALVLFIGASTALVLCHVVPATCASTVRALFRNRVGRILRWPAGAWFCLGAATSLGQLAHLSGSMFALWRNAPYLEEQWWWIAIGIAATPACLLAAVVLAWQRVGRQWPVIALLLITGLCLAVTALGAHLRGLRTRNPQLISEEGLDDLFGTAKGMLIAAAPASILAVRIDKIGLSRKRIWWTGICGVWVPLVASVALVSLAKMAGARLYWKPSLPIEFTYAFTWPFLMTDKVAALLWSLALTVSGPCLICALDKGLDLWLELGLAKSVGVFGGCGGCLWHDLAAPLGSLLSILAVVDRCRQPSGGRDSAALSLLPRHFPAFVFDSWPETTRPRVEQVLEPK